MADEDEDLFAEEDPAEAEREEARRQAAAAHAKCDLALSRFLRPETSRGCRGLIHYGLCRANAHKPHSKPRSP